ncbi:hypothetical protein DFH27DRAFT_607256 [Peziza echinospora]|nr:hypothetical protein DFH27DRAFT_607256 [Peziza echinospora]
MARMMMTRHHIRQQQAKLAEVAQNVAVKPARKAAKKAAKVVADRGRGGRGGRGGGRGGAKRLYHSCNHGTNMFAAFVFPSSDE